MEKEVYSRVYLLRTFSNLTLGAIIDLHCAGNWTETLRDQVLGAGQLHTVLSVAQLLGVLAELWSHASMYIHISSLHLDSSPIYIFTHSPRTCHHIGGMKGLECRGSLLRSHRSDILSGLDAVE